MEVTREKIGGIAGTIIFAILLLLILLFSYFTLNTPPEELEGIPVMFGSVEDAYGAAEPPMSEPTPLPAQQTEPPVSTPEYVVLYNRDIPSHIHHARTRKAICQAYARNLYEFNL